MKERDAVRLREIASAAECERVFRVYNDLSQRATIDHDEAASIKARIAAYEEHEVWTAAQAL